MRISVITVTFNSEKVLTKCLDSVEAQTYKKIDHIVIDGASTDDTLLLLESRRKQLSILVHPKSYIHAIVKFNNGMTKIIAHDTNMRIPIFNSLYDKKTNKIKTDQLDVKRLNFLNFKKVDTNKFPSIKLINKFENKETLQETNV